MGSWQGWLLGIRFGRQPTNWGQVKWKSAKEVILGNSPFSGSFFIFYLFCLLVASAWLMWPVNILPRKLNLLDTRMQRSRGKSSRVTPQKLETGGTSPCQRDLRNKETLEKTNVAKSSRQADLQPEGEDGKETEDLPYMTTTEMYLCCWQQPPASPLLDESPKKEEDVTSMCLAQMQNGSCTHWFTNYNTKKYFLSPIMEGKHHGTPSGGGCCWHPRSKSQHLHHMYLYINPWLLKG